MELMTALCTFASSAGGIPLRSERSLGRGVNCHVEEEVPQQEA